MQISKEINDKLQAFNDAGIPCEISPVVKEDTKEIIAYAVKIFTKNGQDVWSATSKDTPEECIEWIKQRGNKFYSFELKKLTA